MTLQFPWQTMHRDIFSFLGQTTYFVGGCVRNTFMGLPLTQDWDLATALTPSQVIQALRGSTYKVIPTGIDHGTVTVITPKHTYEITTLRQDMATDGRYAQVKYTSYVSLDAGRRDFTMNALYLDTWGHVWDYVGGYEDIATQRVRFIGNATQRIREDYLRILRYFRFHSNYGRQWHDESLQACLALAPGVPAYVSAPRMTKEVRSLLDSRKFWHVYEVMQYHKVWNILFQGAQPRMDDGAPMAELETYLHTHNLKAYIPLVRWVFVGSCTLNLSWYRWERRFLSRCWHAPHLSSLHDLFPYILSGHESPPFRLALWIVLAWRHGYTQKAINQGAESLRHADAFPVTGHDVMALGYRGSAVAKVLSLGKTWWLQHQGKPPRAEVIHYIQTIPKA